MKHSTKNFAFLNKIKHSKSFKVSGCNKESKKKRYNFRVCSSSTRPKSKHTKKSQQLRPDKWFLNIRKLVQFHSFAREYEKGILIVTQNNTLRHFFFLIFYLFFFTVPGLVSGGVGIGYWTLYDAGTQHQQQQRQQLWHQRYKRNVGLAMQQPQQQQKENLKDILQQSSSTEVSLEQPQGML